MRLTVIKDFVKLMKLSGLWDERRFIAGTLISAFRTVHLSNS
jgi:hypothetical protein